MLACNTAPLEEMPQRWRAVAPLFDLTSPRLEPWTSRSGDERVAARLTDVFCTLNLYHKINFHEILFE